MSRLSVLLIEDENQMAGCLIQMLVRNGFSVLLARDVEAAWDLFQATRPRAVITNNRLVGAGMVGVDLPRRLKAASPETPVILLTGTPPDDARGTCDIVLSKPSAPATLVPALASVGVYPERQPAG